MLSSQRLWPASCSICVAFIVPPTPRAARRATARHKLGGYTSINLRGRVVPAIDVLGQLLGFGRTPGSRLILQRWSFVAEDGLNDRPLRLDRVLVGEQQVVASHR